MINKTNSIVKDILNALNDTREDNIIIQMKTKYFNKVRNILEKEYDLSLDYEYGNKDICWVNVCPFVDEYEIGEKIEK